MTLNLDRSAWRTVKFGDVALNANDYFNRTKDGELPYVAGLHIDPTSALVSEWGMTSDDDFPPTFKRLFRRGDVLLHSRGVEKIAVVDRRGVTGEKLFVLRTRDQEVLDQRFLVWLLRSPAASQYFQANFSGSVNKFLNWRPLEAFQFALPPIDQQRRIANLLWAVDSHLRSLESELEALGQLISAYCIDVYEQATVKGEHVPVSGIGDVMMGRAKSPKYTRGVAPRPYLAVGNVGTLELSLSRVSELDFEDEDFAKYKLVPGDVLITEGDLVSALNVGRSVVYEGLPKDACYQNHLLRLRPNGDACPEYLVALIEGMRLKFVFAGSASTTTITSLGLKRFRSLSLPMLDACGQQLVAGELRQLLSARAAVRQESVEARALLSRLIQGVAP